MKKSTLLLVALAAGTAMSLSAADKAEKYSVKKTTSEASLMTQKQFVVKDVKKLASPVIAKDSRYTPETAVAPKTSSDLNAYYEVPDGMFHYGLTYDRKGFDVDFVFGGAHVPVTFKNQSTGATSYVWTYTDPLTFDGDLTSNDENLTVTYPWSSLTAPVLSASDGTNNDTYDPYTEYKAGGVGYQGVYAFGGDTKDNSGAAAGITTTRMQAGSEGYSSFYNYCYNVSGEEGFDPNGFRNAWNTAIFNEGETDVRLTSFCNIFPKPNSTYCISQLWTWASITASAETELECKIWEVDDEGKITDNLIAFGTAVIPAGEMSEMPVFDLKTIDEFGFESSDPINISTAIMVELTGFFQNPGITELSPVASCNNVYDPNSSNPFINYRHALCKFEYKDADGQDMISYFYNPWSYFTDETRTTLCAVTDWMFMLDAEFWWLDADEYEYHFPNEGGSYDIDMYGYRPHALPDADGNEYYWSAEPVDPEADVDWLEISFDSQVEFDPEANEDAYTGVTVATFTAEPLPEGVEGRSVDVKVSYPGAELVISLSQGVLGVKDVTVKSAQYVNVVGNDFVVKATSDVTKAEVYTAAGVKVAEAAVNGTATINAAGLAHGVYFVKLNNGKTVKVVK